MHLRISCKILTLATSEPCRIWPAHLLVYHSFLAKDILARPPRFCFSDEDSLSARHCAKHR